MELGFLVVAALVLFAAGGARRNLGRAFDLACVAALPMSTCPAAITCLRPSSANDLVRPVIACLVATPSPSDACTCDGSTEAGHVESSDFAFDGIVLGDAPRDLPLAETGEPRTNP